MMPRAPYYPIVYVRGYAGTETEVEDTVADPYMGFNVGATKLRQLWDGEIKRHIFESPLVRLMKDYGYRDAFADGDELTGDRAIPWKTIWIYRYYEPVSKDLGTGERPEIEVYGEGLGEFLKDIRDRTCRNSKKAHKDFKVHLVAHSMGGLVVRCWLQNIRYQETSPVAVEKIFTYATPHRGIDFRLIGNIPKFIQINNSENFNEDRMRKYLAISSKKVPVTSLDGKFPADKFFSLIGTNAKDYVAAHGLSSKAVGPLSDGLVQIRNAYVAGSPRAFVHRSHSGHFGIVNSEEGYQNLRRFFFGDLRVDGHLQIKEITLPRKVEQAKKKGKEIRASYHIEVVTRVRDARWDLHRRTVAENSAIFAPYDDMVEKKKPIALFSAFLSKAAILKNSSYMGFAIDLGIQVPEYRVDNRFFFDDHFEGSYIFRDKLTLMLKRDKSAITVKYGWDQDATNDADKIVEPTATDNGWILKIDVVKAAAPGINAQLVLTVR